MGPSSSGSMVRWYKSITCRGRCRRNKRPRSPSSLRSPPSLPLSRDLLPTELVEKIADYLFQPRVPHDSDASAICCIKPSWVHVAGFMNASKGLHQMGLIRWMQVLTIKCPEDWNIAQHYSNWIRELTCLDGSFARSNHQRILLNFDRLCALSVDAHSDVTHNEHNQFAYRNLFLALPPSIRRLEITHAHGPDLRIIGIVKECCPNIEVLRLGRCTIFNNPSPCDFWRSFPLDHDSYMSNEGTDSYAHALAQELYPLRSLKNLRLGLYLIPSTTVLAHRIYHRRGLAAPAVIEWQQAIGQVPGVPGEPDPADTHQLVSLLHEQDPPTEFGPEGICAICSESVAEMGRNAETSANTILKGLVPTLEKVEWMGWLTSEHLGLNSYDVSVTS